MTSRTGRIAAGGSLLLGSTAALMGFGAHTAGADGTTFVIDSLADHFGPGLPDACAPPTSGECTLRDAIAASNASPGTDTIVFDPSVTGTIELLSNLEPIDDSVVISGPGAENLTVDGQRASHGFLEDLDHLSDPDYPDFSLELSGLHLTRLTGVPYPGITTGAVSVLSGSLDLHDLVVTDSGSIYSGYSVPFLNAPVNAGAFAYGFRTMSSVTIERVVIADNQTDGAGGQFLGLGSLFVIGRDIRISDTTVTGNSSPLAAGPVLLGGAVEINGLTVRDNTSTGDYAGALVRCSACTISGAIIERNSSNQSSGLTLYGDSRMVDDEIGRQPVRVTDSLIASNSSPEGSTVVVGTLDSPVLFERVSIVENFSGTIDPLDLSTSTQAAVSVFGDLNLLSSTIANNSSDGIALIEDGPDDPLVASRPLAGQKLMRSMGLTNLLQPQRRIRTSADPILTPTLIASHSTITGNAGIGIRTAADSRFTPAAASVLLNHALIHGNRLGDVSTPSTARFSLIGSPLVAPAIGIFDGPGGNNIIGVDPDLQPLEWTSDFTVVVPIRLGSAAWNAGDPAFAPPPDTDQRGLPRVVDIIDIGAYEVQAPLVLPSFTG